MPMLAWTIITEHEKQKAKKHSRFVDLTGQRFSHLFVVDLYGRQHEGHRAVLGWLCRCDCGKEKIISGNSLRRKHIIGCGDKIHKRKFPEDISIMRALFRTYKHKCEHSGMEHQIDYDYFVSFLKQPCFYCGDKETNEYRGFKYNGLDRIDSNRGYVCGNIVACCFPCNEMKKARKRKDFLAHITKIYLHSVAKLSTGSNNAA